MQSRSNGQFRRKPAAKKLPSQRKPNAARKNNVPKKNARPKKKVVRGGVDKGFQIVQAPAAYGTSYKNPTPGANRVSNTEYVRALAIPSTPNNIVSIPINPANPDMFPWLSGLAGNYEFYHFNKLRFEFRATRSTNSNGTMCGVIDYDSRDTAIGTREKLLSFAGAISVPLWKPNTILEAKQRGPLYNAAPSEVPTTGVDVRMYNLGNLNVTIDSDLTEGTLAFDLFAHYEVVFSSPKALNALTSVLSTKQPYAPYPVWGEAKFLRDPTTNVPFAAFDYDTRPIYPKGSRILIAAPEDNLLTLIIPNIPGIISGECNVMKVVVDFNTNLDNFQGRLTTPYLDHKSSEVIGIYTGLDGKAVQTAIPATNWIMGGVCPGTTDVKSFFNGATYFRSLQTSAGAAADVAYQTGAFLTLSYWIVAPGPDPLTTYELPHDLIINIECTNMKPLSTTSGFAGNIRAVAFPYKINLDGLTTPLKNQPRRSCDLPKLSKNNSWEILEHK